MTDFKAGDYVRFRLGQFKEIEGTVLESHDSSIVLVKLPSGYNIGLQRDNIHGYEVVKKYKEQEKKKEIEPKKNLPKIGLIICGGTIASKLDYTTGAVKPLTAIGDFQAAHPKLFENYNVKVERPFTALSANMNSEHWIQIAEVAEKMLNDSSIEGVIITQGTDTIHYTAAALSFFLKNLNKPVVFTYSQRSIDRAGSDAELNLLSAAKFALSDCAQVVLVGHASLNEDFCYALTATKAKKLHTSRRDAFKPVNIGPLAKISDKVEFLRMRKARNKEKVELDTSFSDKIALVKFYPGQDPEILDYYQSQGYKGLIIEATGLGHVAAQESKNSWVPKLKKIIKEGMIVCAAAQTMYGRLNPKVYSYGRELESTGMIYLEDMLAETALVKLGWVLGHKNWKTLDKAKEKMLESVAGELNKNLID